MDESTKGDVSPSPEEDAPPEVDAFVAEMAQSIVALVPVLCEEMRSVADLAIPGDGDRMRRDVEEFARQNGNGDPATEESCRMIYQYQSLIMAGITLNRIMTALKAQGVETGLRNDSAIHRCQILKAFLAKVLPPPRTTLSKELRKSYEVEEQFAEYTNEHFEEFIAMLRNRPGKPEPRPS